MKSLGQSSLAILKAADQRAADKVGTQKSSTLIKLYVQIPLNHDEELLCA